MALDFRVQLAVPNNDDDDDEFIMITFPTNSRSSFEINVFLVLTHYTLGY